MMQKHSFPSNYRWNYILGSVSDVLSSFCVFVPRKMPKKPDFFNIFCKKSEFFFFFKISENGGGLKTDSQDDFPFDFFCYFSVFITDLCFLMTNTIFRFFSIFLKNCSEICSFSGIWQFPHFFHFCVKMKINMSIRVKMRCQ